MQSSPIILSKSKEDFVESLYRLCIDSITSSLSGIKFEKKFFTFKLVYFCLTTGSDKDIPRDNGLLIQESKY